MPRIVKLQAIIIGTIICCKYVYNIEKIFHAVEQTGNFFWFYALTSIYAPKSIFSLRVNFLGVYSFFVHI